MSYILPRPELSDLLGITYRRIPVLAIGNDVYCDTSLIATALERRFPATKGYSKSARGTIFPRRNATGKTDKELIRTYTKYYLEGELFPPATNHLPYERLPANFLQDRAQVHSVIGFASAPSAQNMHSCVVRPSTSLPKSAGETIRRRRSHYIW